MQELVSFVPSFCYVHYLPSRLSLIMGQFFFLTQPPPPRSDSPSLTFFFFLSLSFFKSAVDGSASVRGRFVQLFELSGSLVRLISLRTPDGGEERNPCGGHAAHTRTDSHFPHSFVLFSSPSLVPRRLVRASMPPAPLSKEYVSSFLPVFTVCRGTDDASF